MIWTASGKSIQEVFISLPTILAGTVSRVSLLLRQHQDARPDLSRLSGILLAIALANALPSTAITYVLDPADTTLGMFNGYDSFLPPGPSHPFHATAASGDDSTLTGNDVYVVDSVLACYSDSTGTAALFTVLPSTPMKISSWGGGRHLNATDTAGGANPSDCRTASRSTSVAAPRLCLSRSLSVRRVGEIAAVRRP